MIILDVYRRDGQLQEEVRLRTPPKPAARQVQAQHEAGHLRVGAEGRGHPLHHRVVRGRQRGQAQGPPLQFVSKRGILYFVQE